MLKSNYKNNIFRFRLALVHGFAPITNRDAFNVRNKTDQSKTKTTSNLLETAWHLRGHCSGVQWVAFMLIFMLCCPFCSANYTNNAKYFPLTFNWN